MRCGDEAAIATLASPNEPWPAKSAKDLGQKFRGYRLTPDQRPTFLYSTGDIEIEDNGRVWEIDAALAAHGRRYDLKLSAETFEVIGRTRD